MALTLAKHVAAQLEERAFCVVFEHDLERCWPRKEMAPDKMADAAFKVCRFCNEQIRQEAVKCRFCREWLEPSEPDSAPVTSRSDSRLR
jgi:hypothetical protein